MYELILENKEGDRLIFNELGGAFQITDISGLNPPNAIINTSEVALMDGQVYVSSKLEMRTINLAFAIDYSAAENRIRAYSVIRAKRPIRLYYKSDTRDIYIDGYVQMVDVTYFEMKQIITVTIICPQPYLRSAQDIISDLSSLISMFYFPFASTAGKELVFSEIDSSARVAIENDGEIDAGMVIEMYCALYSVTNPKIYNYDTHEFIGADVTLNEGDRIIINTTPGERSITLESGGEKTNIFNLLAAGSTWLTLPPGESTFIYRIGSGQLANLIVSVTHANLYQGV